MGRTCQNESLKDANGPGNGEEQASGHLFRAPACAGTVGADSISSPDEDQGWASADGPWAASQDVSSPPLLPVVRAAWPSPWSHCSQHPGPSQLLQ